MSRAQGCVGPALRGAITYRIAVGVQAGGFSLNGALVIALFFIPFLIAMALISVVA
jgi:hypothetical protein